jgi:uncharacterized protein with HEPN domain
MSVFRLPDYLDHMRQAVSDILVFIEGLSKPDFLADKKTQAAVAMNLIVLGEAATKINDQYPSFATKHPKLPWRQIRGMRNAIAHGYFDIDFEIVFDTVTESLPSLLKLLSNISCDESDDGRR